MCGIFFSLSRHGYIAPSETTTQLLRNRGPDSIRVHKTRVPALDGRPAFYATFVSTVLSLRGSEVVAQPLQHASGSVLCWNGEAWSIGGHSVLGNDSTQVFNILMQSCSPATSHDSVATISSVIRALSELRGPSAFVFFDAANQYLYFGRDCLGRRSLLRRDTADGELILCSVGDKAPGVLWNEVEADGLYVLNLRAAASKPSFHVAHIPQSRRGAFNQGELTYPLPFPAMNQSLDNEVPSVTDSVDRLRKSLHNSLKSRIHHVREAVDLPVDDRAKKEPKVAILFSGGLDCTILARMSHDLLPASTSIDLLNVAFENPRTHKNIDPSTSPFELCPDRITGRSSHAELTKTCPDRIWQFVEINVPYTQTVAHRAKVMSLMLPHNTEMDLSIAYALYFASRGAGVVRATPDTRPSPYTPSARVLLSGLGADELFGGYQRHIVAFTKKGYQGLLEELTLDFDRLGKRNLGRDDRVISDSGREVRFPYLDEEFIASALELPVTAKCDFANVQIECSNNPAQALEPSKRVLRLLAWKLGMRKVASEKKRAIQFGARTAKMEAGKTKGTHVLS